MGRELKTGEVKARDNDPEAPMVNAAISVNRHGVPYFIGIPSRAAMQH